MGREELQGPISLRPPSTGAGRSREAPIVDLKVATYPGPVGWTRPGPTSERSKRASTRLLHVLFDQLEEVVVAGWFLRGLRRRLEMVGNRVVELRLVGR